ncbi:MAG: preprotein translocase subunit YajC [Mycobacterium sp.]
MAELTFFLPVLIILAAFMFFGSRRQRKAMQATISLHESLRIGDRVHTTSGLEASIAAVSDDTVDLEIAPGVVTTWMKLAIRDKIEATDDEFDDDEFDDDEFDDDEYDDDVDVDAADNVELADSSGVELSDTANYSEPNRLTKD